MKDKDIEKMKNWDTLSLFSEHRMVKAEEVPAIETFIKRAIIKKAVRRDVLVAKNGTRYGYLRVAEIFTNNNVQKLFHSHRITEDKNVNFIRDLLWTAVIEEAVGEKVLTNSQGERYGYIVLPEEEIWS